MIGVFEYLRQGAGRVVVGVGVGGGCGVCAGERAGVRVSRRGVRGACVMRCGGVMLSASQAHSFG